jgi:hypothetical protein
MLGGIRAKRKEPPSVGHGAPQGRPSKVPKLNKSIEPSVILQLPTELLMEIFLLADSDDLRNIRSVCGRFRSVADSDAVYWRRIQIAPNVWINEERMKSLRRALRQSGSSYSGYAQAQREILSHTRVAGG